MNSPEQNEQVSALTLEPKEIKWFFLNHLNRIYCAKAHLIERLPELVDLANFQDLKYAITETMEDIDKQIVRMQEIFTLLDCAPTIENCGELIEFLEDGFAANYQESENLALRDLSILFYLSLIESVEVASFRILIMFSVKLPHKQIRQLLQENLDESKADRFLFTQIAANYVS